MKNYFLLQDEAKLAGFLALLPETTEDECYLVYLLARTKYLSSEEKEHYHLGKKTVLARKIAADKSKIKPKVLELCVPEESFIDKDGNVLLQHCLAVYISLQPRSHKKAGLELIKKLADSFYANETLRLDMAVFTQLQQQASRKHILDVDIDADKDTLKRVLKEVKEIMGMTPLHILHTRGGAHVLIQKDKIDSQVSKRFYQNILVLNKTFEGEIGIDNDSLVPLAGCYQGGFVPYTESYENG